MLVFKLAWRNLFRNVRRTILTCLLISSSLTILIIADGLVIGMVKMMVGGITHTLAGEAQVHKKGFLDNFDPEFFVDNPDEIYSALESDTGVSGYAPRVMVGGMIASTYNVTGGLVYGVDATRELDVSKLKIALIAGDYLSGKHREILIGKRMAETLEVDLGDRIVVTAAEVETSEIAQELFRVSGIFEFGPREMDQSLVFINLDQAQTLFGMTNRIHQVAVRFHQSEDAKNRQLPLYKSLTNDKIEALGWLDFNPAIGAMVEMSNMSTLIIGIVLFILATLGVINSMFMSIYERIYEFGVVRAIGTTPMQLVQLVMCEALLLALISCVVGNFFGLTISYYFQEYGLPMGTMEISGVVIDGNIYTELAVSQFINFPFYIILLTLAAAIYPARFAAKIIPTEALHRSL